MDVVIFECGPGVYALPAVHVLEVLPPAPVTPLPFLPLHVEGLVAHAGNVVTQLGLSTILDVQESDEGEQSLLIFQTHGFRYALRIGRVISMTAVDDDLLTLSNDASDPPGSTPSPIAGEFRWREETVLFLDIDLLGRGDWIPERVPDGENEVIGLDDSAETSELNDGGIALQCLLVMVGNERFGLRLDYVLEVLEQGGVTPLPYAPKEVAGILYLREKPFLTFSLPHLLGFNPDPESTTPNPSHPLVILHYRGFRIAFKVERVLGIEGFPEQSVHPVSNEEGQLEAFLHDRKDRFVGLIDLRSLIPDALWKRTLPSLPKERERQRATDTADQAQRFLTMKNGEEFFALPLDVVERVVVFQPYELLPENVNPVLDGVVQLHGQVLPVADLRQRFHSRHPEDIHTAYVVARAGDHAWALAVDEVFRLVEIPSRSIDPIARGQKDFVGAIGRLNGHIYSLLTMEPLLHAAESHG